MKTHLLDLLLDLPQIGIPSCRQVRSASDAPPEKVDYAEMVTAITAICDEFEAYGYRRVGAELRHQGMIVNSKKIRRLMRSDLQPKRRRRFVATTDPGPCSAAIRTRQPPKGCIHHFGPRFAVRF